MPMARRNIVAGLALLAFGSWYAYLAGNLPTRDVMPNTPGPAFFPTIIVVSVMALSAALVVAGFRAEPTEASGKSKPQEGYEPFLAVGAFLVFLAALPHAGFIVCSIPFFGALMYLYGSRNWLMIAVLSVVVPLALYIIFRHGFQIVLPRGILAF